jgi:hypothetical protein
MPNLGGFMEGVFIVKEKDLEKIRVLQMLGAKQITQEQAALQLNITDRQVRNIFKKYKEIGNEGVISKKIGKPSNRKFSEDFKKQIVTIIKTKYHDFKPTLVTEKLRENHEIKISVEFIRQLMISEHLWKVTKGYGPVIHPLRPRRGSLGEMSQGDASHHLWFENRGSPCALIVIIDDATSAILALYFTETETLEAYFAALRIVLMKYGRPLSMYTDHFSVFEVARKNPSLEEQPITQFKRALGELEVELILANTPQAKGRVERANRTLQDRLVKELRLEGISDINTANAWLEKSNYIEKHNAKFAVPPRNKGSVLRPLTEHQLESLDRILSPNHKRVVQKDLSFQYKGDIYQIYLEERIDLRGKRITVWEDSTHKVKAEYEGKNLCVGSMKEKEWFSRNPSTEQLLAKWKTKKHYKPSSIHPYKRNYKT